MKSKTVTLDNTGILADPGLTKKDLSVSRYMKVSILAGAIVVLALFVIYARQYTRLSKRIKYLEAEKRTLRASLEYTAGQYPVIITGISFKNGLDNDFLEDNTFKSSETKYVYPIISFYQSGGTSLDSLELEIKILDGEGKLLTNSRFSPRHFTMKYCLRLTAGVPVASFIYPPPPPKKIALPRWESPVAPSYPVGDYTVQLWYRNKCLYESGFKII